MNDIATTNGINSTTLTASIKTTFQNNIANFKRTLETTKNIIFNNNKYQKLQGFSKALDQNPVFNLSSIDLETLNILRIEKIITHNTYFTTDDQTIIKNNEDSPKKDEYFITHAINNFNKNNLKASIQSKINSLLAPNIPADIKSEVENNTSKVLRNKFNDLSEERKKFTKNIKYSLLIRGEIKNAATEIEDTKTCLGKLYDYFTTSSQNFEQMYELNKNIIIWLMEYFPSDYHSLKSIRNKTQLDASQQTICSYNHSWIARVNQIYFNMDAANDKYIPSKIRKKLMLDDIDKVYDDHKYTSDQKDYYTYAAQKNKLALKANLLKFIDYLISVKSTLVGISSDNTPLLDLKKFDIKVIHEAHKNTNITPNDNYFFVAQSNLDDFKLFATTMFNKSFKITSNNFGKNKLTNLIAWLRSSKENLVTEIMTGIHNIDNKPLAVIAANNNAIDTDDHIRNNIQTRSSMVQDIERLQRIRWDILVVIKVIEQYKSTNFSIANIANNLNASFSVPIISEKDRTWITGFIDETTVATLGHLEDALRLQKLRTKLDKLWDSWQTQQKDMKSDIQNQIENDLKAINTRIKNDQLDKHGAAEIKAYTDEDIGYSDEHESADKKSFAPYYSSIRLSEIKAELSKFKNYINQILKNQPSDTQQIKMDKNLITTDLIRALNYKSQEPDGTDLSRHTVLENSALTQKSFFKSPTYMQDGSPADIPANIAGLATNIPQTAKDFYYIAVNSLQGLPKSKKYKLEIKTWAVAELKKLHDALELKTSSIWSKQADEVKTLSSYSNLLQDNLKFKSFTEEYKFYYEKIMEDLDSLEKVNEMVSLISELKIKMEQYHASHEKYKKASKTFMTKSPIQLKLAKASFELVERLNDLDNPNAHNILTEAFIKKLNNQSGKNIEKELLDLLMDNATFEKLYNGTVSALEVLTTPESDGIKQSLVGKNTMVNGVNIAFDYNLRIIDLANKIQHILTVLRSQNPIKYGNGIISITGGKIVVSDFNSRRLRFETNREEQKSYLEHYADLQKILSKFSEAINYVVNTFFIMSADMDYDEYSKILDKSTFKKPTPIEKIIGLIQDPRIINLIHGFAIREHSDDSDKKAINVLKDNQTLFTIPTKMQDGNAVPSATVNDNEWKNQSDYYIMNNQLVNKNDKAKLFNVKGVEYNRAEFKDMLANAILLQKVITNQSQSQSVRIQDTELFITNTIEALVEFIKAFKRLCDLIIANVIL